MAKTPDELEKLEIPEEHRDAILAELRKIDPNLTLKIIVSSGDKASGGHFSDWHDSFKDGPRWSKTFGKAGGQ